MAIFNRSSKEAKELRTAITLLQALGITGASSTTNGKISSTAEALKVSAVLRSVDLIANTIASIGCDVYERADAGGRKIAETHYLHPLLKYAPNESTTPFDFWNMLIYNLLLTNGAYVWIKKDKDGMPEALWNLPTAVVTRNSNTNTGESYIDVIMPNGQTLKLYPSDYIFIRGRRLDSDVYTQSIVDLAGEVIGVSRRLDEFAAGYFDNGAVPSGVLYYEGNLNDAGVEALITKFRAQYAGAQNAGKVMATSSKLKFEPFMGKDPDKGQALESRKFQVTEIARLFGVPPHLLFEMDRATYNNAEQLNTEFVTYGLDPYCVRIEQAFGLALIKAKTRGTYYCKFNTKSLLRGDIKTRTEHYNVMRQGGIYNADEIREFEDMPAQPGGVGKEYFINGNMMTVSNAKNNKGRAATNGGSAPAPADPAKDGDNNG